MGYNGEKVEEEVKEPAAEVKEEEKTYMNENMGEYGVSEEYSRYGKRSATAEAEDEEEEAVAELPEEETSQKPYARRPYGRNPRRYNNGPYKTRKSYTPAASGDYYHGDTANRGEYASGVNYSRYGKRSAPAEAEEEEEVVTELPEEEETSQKPYARRPYGRNPRQYNNNPYKTRKR